LVYSSKEKKVKRVCSEAIALVERLNDVHMNTLPWHELQAWRSDDAKSDWEERRSYVQGGTDKTVVLAGCADGLVEQTVGVVKDWLACAAPRPVSECAQMDDTRVLTALDVTSADVVNSVLDLTRYPEEAAATLKNEIEAERMKEEEERLKAEAEAKKKAEEERLKAEAEAKKKAEEERLKAEAEAKKKAEEERLKAEAEAKKKAEEERLKAEAEAKKKAEEERLKAEAEAKKKAEEERLKAEAEAKKKAEEAERVRVASVARAFRRRCFQAAAAACMFLLFFALYRADRLPSQLRRLLAVLLFRLRRR
jgi:hypothetical protein